MPLVDPGQPLELDVRMMASALHQLLRREDALRDLRADAFEARRNRRAPIRESPDPRLENHTVVQMHRVPLPCHSASLTRKAPPLKRRARRFVILLESAVVSDPCILTATMHATAAEALQAVELAFAKAHVFLTEAHQLGGHAVVVHWDMEGDRRQQLVDALLEASVDLDESTFESLRGPWNGTLTGSLNVTLEHEGRDTKVPVPAVPG
jgi:hypothetical protein